METSLLKRFVVGAPMPLSLARHERLSKKVALAVFASDALSSTAYATEEILRVLVLAGSAALGLAIWVAVAIALLLIVVAISYQQTIRAYPNGGGSYIVARVNLGPTPGLVAAASLMIDYVLTVSVSVAAGVAAITSAFPALFPYRVTLGVACIALIAFGNLRGVRESGRIFAVPTYLFIFTFGALVLTGLIRYALGEVRPLTETVLHPATALSGFLVLRAFASGCTAMTGMEAISNGVPAFKEPEAHNAAVTSRWMAGILAVLFLGLTLLAQAYRVVPVEHETVVSMLGRALFGRGAFYYLIQAATALILILAANTSFAGFPRLASLLSQDRYAPRQFAKRGDRLVFSNGIVILGAFAALLVIAFRGDTHALIPLYAVGVFISFTLSQAGMVRHWHRERGPGWRWRLLINGTGALLTGVVTIVIAVTKFTHGAWIVVLLVPILVLMFQTVNRHYALVADQLSLEGYGGPPPIRHTVLVPIGDVHRGVVAAVQYAKLLSPEAKAVYVETDPVATRALEEKWIKWGMGVPLVILTSPYRSVLTPLLEYIDHLQEEQGEVRRVVTVVLPEFIPHRWWQHLLHNQTALLIKGALLFRKDVIVTDVPYHLAH
ncbi:MAG: amino acid permease [Candidatus Rokuibacteriota bacterium]|nr:MAG: amino acid permease [Candidatus Rokubacteria bacterium]